jgi:hypothetical protein
VQTLKESLSFIFSIQYFLMDSHSVKERLLRLNKEVHDERFADRDLTVVLKLWDQAKASYDRSEYGRA